VSPFCAQNETAPAQMPLLQTREQQSPCAEHSLPAVRHDGFSGTHVPLPASAVALHFPPQHSAEVEQAWLSDVQSLAPHVPLLQTKVQQSCGIAQELPAVLQSLMGFAQMPFARSQLAVQQSSLLVHVAPTSRQVVASTPEPPAPPVPVAVPPEPSGPFVPPDPVSALELVSNAASARPALPPVLAPPLVPHPMPPATAQIVTKQAYRIRTRVMPPHFH
jgi:hypothetical protein